MPRPKLKSQRRSRTAKRKRRRTKSPKHLWYLHSLPLGFSELRLITSWRRSDVPTVLLSQGSSGHKRAPSDASVASSEDDKVPPTQSTLESVLEKPTEDQIQEKSSNKGLKTSETDETKEKEVSQAASNEDLLPASNESKDLGPQQPGEPKEDIPAKENVVPTEAVEPQQEASVNTPDTEKAVTGGQETEKQEEKQEEKTNDFNKEEEKKEMEEDKIHLETDGEIKEGVEKSSRLEEQHKDAPEQPESVESEQEKKEESKGPEEVSSQQEVAEDKMEDTTDSIVDLKETSSGGDDDPKLKAVEAPAAAPTEEQREETTQEQEEEKDDGKAPEEPALPQQDVEVEEPEPVGSTNAVSDIVSKTSEGTEPVTLRKEEEAARVDDNSCQDAVSVQESETDSESKTEQGSPAVVKPDVEKDSDSGSSSAADNSSLDLNLSISSFLSKSKEGGSVSMQVSWRILHLHHIFSQIITCLVLNMELSPGETSCGTAQVISRSNTSLLLFFQAALFDPLNVLEKSLNSARR